MTPSTHKREMPSEETPWDVIVIGAGAAGMVAATRAASRQRRVLLLEKNRKLGVKILISGGTRCNLTHNTDVRGVLAAFPKQQAKFLRTALHALPPEKVIELVEGEGVATKAEATGKIFPVSDRAIDVRNAFANMLQRSGAEVQTTTSVQQITKHNDTFRVDTETQTFQASRVIVACGGQSYPGCGTTGDGYQWARALGHKIVQPVPALTPIKSPDPWLHELQGMTLPEVRLVVVTKESLSDLHSIPKSAIRDSRRGSLLFTHFGVSGPSVLDASRAITRASEPGELALLADFWADVSYDECVAGWRSRSVNQGATAVRSVLAERHQRRLAESLLTQCNIDPTRKLAELSKAEITRLVQQEKRCPIHVSGTQGFSKAEVTAGGVALNEVDPKTMQSKLVTGLYFIGEVLDIDGPIGGYNFQAAFSTGWLAGSHV